jgi:hypothetical protein
VTKEEPKKGRIYNNLGFSGTHEESAKEEPPVSAPKPSFSQSLPEIVDDDEEDNEWGVPAFLRRSKLK